MTDREDLSRESMQAYDNVETAFDKEGGHDEAHAGEAMEIEELTESPRLAAEPSTELVSEPSNDGLDDVEKTYDSPPIDDVEDQDNANTSVVAGNIRAGGPVLVGGKVEAQIFGESQETPRLTEVSETTVTRLQGVFVPPPNFLRRAAAITASISRGEEGDRVLIVNGPEHSGKWICAVNLALTIRENKRSHVVSTYSRKADSTLTLVEVIEHEAVKAKQVIILRDGFCGNVTPAELGGVELDNVASALNDKDCFLILTTELTKELLDSASAPTISAKSRGLRKILESHLRFLAGNEEGRISSKLTVEEVLDHWVELGRYFTNPFQVRRFVEGLIELDAQTSGTISSEKLLELTHTTTETGTGVVRLWFSGLSANDKLLALLVHLFEGGERRWIETLHHRLLRTQLKRVGSYSEPLECGLDDSLRAIQASEEAGQIDFVDRTYEEEVQRQVGNWNHLIWYFLSFLVEDLKQEDEWDKWWKRRGLGVAMGRAGVHDRESFQRVLESIGRRESHQTAAIAGYALQETLRIEPRTQAELVTKILQRWITQRSSEHRWAAGAALWKVYLTACTVSEEISVNGVPLRIGTLDLLEKLAEVPNLPEDLKWCASEAMRRIALSDPAAAAGRLTAWLGNTGQKDQQDVARRSIRAIYSTLARSRLKPKPAQLGTFLALVMPLLEVAGKGAKDVGIVFLTLRGWLRWPELEASIFQVFLEMANHGSRSSRESLKATLSELWLDVSPAVAQRLCQDIYPRQGKGGHRQTLRFWLEDTHSKAHRIAQAIIARSLAMDGSVSDLPSVGRAVVAIDPAFLQAFPSKSEELERVKSFCWQVLGMLESRMAVWLVRMGELQTVEIVEDHLAKVELAGEYATHPLIMPGVGGVEGENVELGVVIASRRPHDFEDLLAVPWAQNLNVILAGDVPWGPNEIEPLKIKEAPTDRDMKLVDDALNDRWARRLAFTGPASWLGILHGFGLDIRRVGEIPVVLSRMVSSLGDIEHASGHEDVARIMLCLFLTYASWELDDCLDLLVDWLRSEEEEGGEWRLRRSMAVASSRALLAIHTSYSEDREEQAPLSLFEKLAYPLAAQSRDGIETVLGLVEHWAGHPTWAGYLAGGIQEGQGRLVRWAETFLPDQRGLLESSFTKLASQAVPDQPAISWEALMSTLNQVRIRFSLECPASLPRLEEGRLYGVIVVDTAIRNQEVRKHLGDLGRSLYREFKKSDGAWPVEPVVYRFGEKRPFWAGYPDSPPTSRLIPSDVTLPRLLGPILESGSLTVEKVAFVLVLTNQPIVDLDDWMGSEWWKHIHRYPRDRSKEVKPDFATFPRPMAPERASKEDKELQKKGGGVTGDEVRALMRSLLEGFAKSGWKFAGAESEPLEGTTGGAEG